MPARRRPGRLPRREIGQLLPALRNPAAIETERDRLFSELTKLREAFGPSAKAIETARTLLTKQWSKADWRTREQLIKAAEWLLRLEGIRGAQPSA